MLNSHLACRGSDGLCSSCNYNLKKKLVLTFNILNGLFFTSYNISVVVNNFESYNYNNDNYNNKRLS